MTIEMKNRKRNLTQDAVYEKKIFLSHISFVVALQSNMIVVACC